MKGADRKKFQALKEKIADLVANHGELIKENRFIRVAGSFLEEAQWLVRQVDKLSSDSEIPDDAELAEA